MSDTLYIKPDKEKTYSVNSEEELNYYIHYLPKIFFNLLVEIPCVYGK